MTTLHNIYEDVLKKYEESPHFWCDSHGYRCEECKLDTDKQIDLIKAPFLQFIDSEIERLVLEQHRHPYGQMQGNVGFIRAHQDSITYLQEQRKLIEK